MTEATLRYVAIINTPGYLPESDEPAVFDTAREAWDYLAAERMRDEDDFPGVLDDEDDPFGPSSYSATVRELENYLRDAIQPTGTVYGDSPGHDCDPDECDCHDLGFAYSVEYAEDDDSDDDGWGGQW